MAKKLGKFLLGMAAIGGAAAAAYYYLQKKDAVDVTPENDDEDYDDFSDELEEAPARNYVQLNKEVVTVPVEEEAVEEETAADAVAEIAEDAVEEIVEIVEETADAVEEFFDEEDSVTE